jgi:hypothetical protein
VFCAEPFLICLLLLFELTARTVELFLAGLRLLRQLGQR